MLGIFSEREAGHDDPQNSGSSCGWTVKAEEQMEHQRDVAKFLERPSTFQVRFLKVNTEVNEDVVASVDVTDLSEDISLKKAEVGSCNSWPLH